MKTLSTPNLYLALVHYPVIDKNGDVVVSAVTNLDIHDIGRAAKTYGVKSFFVVTPLDDQKRFVEKIVAHWTRGYGATYNPKRKLALELVEVKNSLDDAIETIRVQEGLAPKIVVTCARRFQQSIEYAELRRMIYQETPYLLVFGTAWGLSTDVIDHSDYILPPVVGCGTYNHLSVRSAASIILDRLVGFK